MISPTVSGYAVSVWSEIEALRHVKMKTLIWRCSAIDRNALGSVRKIKSSLVPKRKTQNGDNSSRMSAATDNLPKLSAMSICIFNEVVSVEYVLHMSRYHFLNTLRIKKKGSI